MKKYLFYFLFLFVGHYDVLSQKNTYQFKDEFGKCTVVFLSKSKLKYTYNQDLTTQYIAKYRIINDTIKLTKFVSGYKNIANIPMFFSKLHDTLYIKFETESTYSMTLLPLFYQKYRRK